MTQRIVLVTGGGSGIGRAIAVWFAGLGDDVVVCGRTEGALEATGAEAPGKIRCVRCDVTNEADVARLFQDVGPLDVLVNNAGAASSAPLHKETLDQWQALFAVNATGAFLCTRAALATMRTRGSGRIVTVASTAGLRGYRYTAAYSASKHAAIGLMRAAAAECAGTAITVNAVCPSFVRTPMTDRTIANIVAKTGRSEDEARADLERASSLGRLVEPEEVAEAVAYLASDGAAAIHGQSLILDGGDLQS